MISAEIQTYMYFCRNTDEETEETEENEVKKKNNPATIIKYIEHF